jgi:hypothetical protein
VTALVLVSAVCIQLIVPVEALAAKATFGVAFEPALIDGTGVVVTKLLMSLQLGVCKKLVFVCENFLVPCTQIAVQCQSACYSISRIVGDSPHDLRMRRLDMAVQIRPAQASNIAIAFRAIVL